MSNEPQALVVFASEYGSTQGVAEHIGTRLGEAGCRSEVHSAERAGDVSSYDAIILGSAVYSGSWIPRALDWARANYETLAERPVWLFSVGAFGDSHRLLGSMMKREPKEIGELLEAIGPRGYRVFAGAIARDRWPSRGRFFFKAFGGRFGDNRDWAQIDDWARGIGDAISAAS